VRHGILVADVTANDTPAQRQDFAALLDQLRAELAPASRLEELIVERIAATFWRTRRVLAYEAGAALERDSTPEPQLDRLLRDIERGDPSDPEAVARARALVRAIAPASAVELAIRYEGHLTREAGRLLTQLEQARRLAALEPA
jgi:hypothetical protein